MSIKFLAKKPTANDARKAQQIAETINKDIGKTIGGMRTLLAVLRERDEFIKEHHGNSVKFGKEVTIIDDEIQMTHDWEKELDEIKENIELIS